MKKFFSKEFFYRADVQLVSDILAIIFFIGTFPNFFLGDLTKIMFGKYALKVSWFFFIGMSIAFLYDFYAFVIYYCSKYEKLSLQQEKLIDDTILLCLAIFGFLSCIFVFILRY